MLEKKINLKLSMRRNDSKEKVRAFFTEYLQAYSNLHKPSLKHIEDYEVLYSEYTKYMKREDIKDA